MIVNIARAFFSGAWSLFGCDWPGIGKFSDVWISVAVVGVIFSVLRLLFGIGSNAVIGDLSESYRNYRLKRKDPAMWAAKQAQREKFLDRYGPKGEE